MTAGLPGTGIGGVYYVLLVACMPVREAWRTLRGRSSPARWAEVLRHVALATTIVAVLFVAAATIQFFLSTGAHRGWIGRVDAQRVLAAGTTWSRLAAFVSFAVLGGLIASGAVARWLLKPSDRSRRRPTSVDVSRVLPQTRAS